MSGMLDAVVEIVSLGLRRWLEQHGQTYVCVDMNYGELER